MSHFVPDFDMDDDYALPSSSSFFRSKKSTMVEDDIMELLWENGQVVTQSQTQRPSQLMKKPTSSPPSKHDHHIPSDHHHHHQSTARDIRGTNLQEPQNHHQNLFMQEDEMAAWLHYPLNDSSFDVFCSDLLYPPPSSSSSSAAAASTTSTTTAVASTTLPTVTALRPPVPPPPRKTELVSNFPLFSRIRERGNNNDNNNNNLRIPVVVRESTVIDSSETPAAARSTTFGRDYGGGAAATRTDTINNTTTTTTNREATTCDITVTSSPEGSSASASAEPPTPSQLLPANAGGQKTAAAAVPEDRKRKGRDEESSEWHSEDAELESANIKKQVRRSTSSKRSRAAEVHNLSERRRRDRINEKMKALQELIPRCNKSDKASMLDEAIEYLKSLQLQVQMMSMGCSMVPMMFPGVQQYIPPMGMGLGVGMGMEMAMNRPVLPFPNVLAGTSLSTPAAANLGPRFPMPAFHMPHVPSPDPSRLQGVNLQDPIMLNSLGMQNARNQLPVPNFADPYQQYFALQQMLVPAAQNQGTMHPSSIKPSASQGADNVGNNQSGT